MNRLFQLFVSTVCLLVFPVAAEQIAHSSLSLQSVAAIAEQAEVAHLEENPADYTQIIFRVESEDETQFSSEMVINRIKQENIYFFVGEMKLSIDPNHSYLINSLTESEFIYSFTIKNGDLLLPDGLDPQIAVIHRALFERLSESIKAAMLDMSEDTDWYAWQPVYLNMSVNISDVVIDDFDCSVMTLEESGFTPATIKRYFELSTDYSYVDTYHINDFDVYGCWVIGTLHNHGQEMMFSIDTGGIGSIGGRRVGCAEHRCDVLNIDLGTDGMLSQ
ncbi:hypothetical protein [Zophobihabitans entericus]|uniref:Uncharacterized protein n=1 Tax=Zophobihabitans entericus TaxID=1635327 RepID=A0A6G9I8N9_9GAMM|nr:hypothetical protein [Zophobihabitans entericus]QIQ20583.1 hypothetical protein IPMB12_02120 [Zophobihabitans entericus]